MRRNAAIAAIAAVVVAVAFALGLWFSARVVNRGDARYATAGGAAAIAGASSSDIGGFVFPDPEPLAAFALSDGEGAPFGPDALRGGWSFLYFGFTYCPDVCPLTLAQMADLKRRLATRCTGLDDRYYLVSVDPDRDTPARLKEYVAYFDPEFRGATGAPEEIAKLAAQAKVFYELPADRSAGYLVGHSSTVTIIDPDGRLHAVLTTPHTGERMAADFALLHERYRARHAGYAARCTA